MSISLDGSTSERPKRVSLELVPQVTSEENKLKFKQRHAPLSDVTPIANNSSSDLAHSRGGLKRSMDNRSDVPGTDNSLISNYTPRGSLKNRNEVRPLIRNIDEIMSDMNVEQNTIANQSRMNSQRSVGKQRSVGGQRSVSGQRSVRAMASTVSNVLGRNFYTSKELAYAEAEHIKFLGKLLNFVYHEGKACLFIGTSVESIRTFGEAIEKGFKGNLLLILPPAVDSMSFSSAADHSLGFCSADVDNIGEDSFDLLRETLKRLIPNSLAQDPFIKGVFQCGTIIYIARPEDIVVNLEQNWKTNNAFRIGEEQSHFIKSLQIVRCCQLNNSSEYYFDNEIHEIHNTYVGRGNNSDVQAADAHHSWDSVGSSVAVAPLPGIYDVKRAQQQQQQAAAQPTLLATAPQFGAGSGDLSALGGGTSSAANSISFSSRFRGTGGDPAFAYSKNFIPGKAKLRQFFTIEPTDRDAFIVPLDKAVVQILMEIAKLNVVNDNARQIVKTKSTKNRLIPLLTHANQNKSEYSLHSTLVLNGKLDEELQKCFFESIQTNRFADDEVEIPEGVLQRRKSPGRGAGMNSMQLKGVNSAQLGLQTEGSFVDKVTKVHSIRSNSGKMTKNHSIRSSSGIMKKVHSIRSNSGKDLGSRMLMGKQSSTRSASGSHEELNFEIFGNIAAKKKNDGSTDGDGIANTAYYSLVERLIRKKQIAAFSKSHAEINSWNAIWNEMWSSTWEIVNSDDSMNNTQSSSRNATTDNSEGPKSENVMVAPAIALLTYMDSLERKHVTLQNPLHMIRFRPYLRASAVGFLFAFVAFFLLILTNKEDNLKNSHRIEPKLRRLEPNALNLQRGYDVFSNRRYQTNFSDPLVLESDLSYGREVVGTHAESRTTHSAEVAHLEVGHDLVAHDRYLLDTYLLKPKEDGLDLDLSVIFIVVFFIGCTQQSWVTLLFQMLNRDPSFKPRVICQKYTWVVPSSVGAIIYCVTLTLITKLASGSHHLGLILLVVLVSITTFLPVLWMVGVSQGYHRKQIQYVGIMIILILFVYIFYAASSMFLALVSSKNGFDNGLLGGIMVSIFFFFSEHALIRLLDHIYELFLVQPYVASLNSERATSSKFGGGVESNIMATTTGGGVVPMIIGGGKNASASSTAMYSVNLAAGKSVPLDLTLDSTTEQLILGDQKWVFSIVVFLIAGWCEAARLACVAGIGIRADDMYSAGVFVSLILSSILCTSGRLGAFRKIPYLRNFKVLLPSFLTKVHDDCKVIVKSIVPLFLLALFLARFLVFLDAPLLNGEINLYHREPAIRRSLINVQQDGDRYDDVDEGYRTHYDEGYNYRDEAERNSSPHYNEPEHRSLPSMDSTILGPDGRNLAGMAVTIDVDIFQNFCFNYIVLLAVVVVVFLNGFEDLVLSAYDANIISNYHALFGFFQIDKSFDAEAAARRKERRNLMSTGSSNSATQSITLDPRFGALKNGGRDDSSNSGLGIGGTTSNVADELEGAISESRAAELRSHRTSTPPESLVQATSEARVNDSLSSNKGRENKRQTKSKQATISPSASKTPPRSPSHDNESPTGSKVVTISQTASKQGVTISPTLSLNDGGIAPTKLGRSSSMFGKSPSALGKSPSMLGKSPSILGKSPSMIASSLRESIRKSVASVNRKSMASIAGRKSVASIAERKSVASIAERKSMASNPDRRWSGKSSKSEVAGIRERSFVRLKQSASKGTAHVPHLPMVPPRHNVPWSDHWMSPSRILFDYHAKAGLPRDVKDFASVADEDASDVESLFIPRRSAEVKNCFAFEIPMFIYIFLNITSALSLITALIANLGTGVLIGNATIVTFEYYSDNKITVHYSPIENFLELFLWKSK